MNLSFECKENTGTVNRVIAENVYFTVSNYQQAVTKYFAKIKKISKTGPEQQRQPPEVFYEKCVLRNFAKFIRKHLCQSLFFNKAAGPKPAILFKKRLWHRYFPVNFAKFLKTPFLQKTSGRLLLEQKTVITAFASLLIAITKT